MTPLQELILNVTGTTFLLAGTTVAARIPRLTKMKKWRFISIAIFLAGAALYVILVKPSVRIWLGFGIGYTGEIATASADDAQLATASTLGAAAFLVALTWIALLPLRFPDWLAGLLHGMRPLLIPGGLIIAGMVVFRLCNDRGDSEETLWTLFLAGAAFLYLWWLSALLFDLVFVWHRYMRTAFLQQKLSGMRASRKTREKKELQEFLTALEEEQDRASEAAL